MADFDDIDPDDLFERAASGEPGAGAVDVGDDVDADALFEAATNPAPTSDGPPQQTTSVMPEDTTAEDLLLGLSQGLSFNTGDAFAEAADEAGLGEGMRWAQDRMPDWLGGTGSHYVNGQAPTYSGVRPETAAQMHARASGSGAGQFGKLAGGMAQGALAGVAMAPLSVARQVAGNAALAGATEYADVDDWRDWQRPVAAATTALGLGTLAPLLGRAAGWTVRRLRGDAPAAPYRLGSGDLDTAALPESTAGSVPEPAALPEPAPVQTMRPPVPVGEPPPQALAAVPEPAPPALPEPVPDPLAALASEPVVPYRPQRTPVVGPAPVPDPLAHLDAPGSYRPTYGGGAPLPAPEPPVLDVPLPVAAAPRKLPTTTRVRGKFAKLPPMALDMTPPPAPTSRYGAVQETPASPYALGDFDVAPSPGPSGRIGGPVLLTPEQEASYALGALEADAAPPVPRVGGRVPLPPEPEATTAAGYALGGLDMTPPPVSAAPKTRAALPWEPAKPLPTPDLPSDAVVPAPYTPSYGLVPAETAETMQLYQAARDARPVPKGLLGGSEDAPSKFMQKLAVGALSFGHPGVAGALYALDNNQLPARIASELRRTLPTELRIQQIVGGLGTSANMALSSAGGTLGGSALGAPPRKAIADAPTMNYALEMAARSAGHTLPPERLQALTAALASRDPAKIAAEQMKAQEASGEFRKFVQETLKGAGEK